MKIFSEVEIEGVKPLLICTFPVDALDSGKAKKGTTGNDRDSWKQTCLMKSDRELYVYNTYLIGSIVSGGKQIKQGKSTLGKKVAATLEIVEPDLMLGRYVPPDEELMAFPDAPVYLDVRSVVNPMTKGRNIRYRIALSAGWKLKATVSWDDRAVSKEDMKQSIENGGLFEGIGDGRRIGFGRYKLNSFTMKIM